MALTANKQVRERKIVIKVQNNIDIVILYSDPEYTISGKLNGTSSGPFISVSRSPENINNVVINANIHSDKKTSAILAGKAAASAMKHYHEISSIIKSKTSYFVTNKLIEKKDKETITAKNQLIKKQ